MDLGVRNVRLIKLDKITIQQAVKTAEELRYPDTVIEKIKKAKSEHEISRILASARKEMKF